MSSALCTPIFTLIENDDTFNYHRRFGSKCRGEKKLESWCFSVFADISTRSNRKKRNSQIFSSAFFRMFSNVSGSVLPMFKSHFEKARGGRAFELLLRFLAGPARINIYHSSKTDHLVRITTTDT